METIKRGSIGESVKQLQKILGLSTDGIFGMNTENVVKQFQKKNGLVADGIVGNKTWEKLLGNNNSNITTPSKLIIENYFLKPGQYLSGKYNNDYIILHGTSGWDNPYQVVDTWNNDKLGKVATEFVVGGQRSTDGRSIYDGKIIRTFPEGCAGYHIGTSGSTYMNTHSVGIEMCNMAHVKNGKTYVNTTVIPSQTYTLPFTFRGFNQFHKYSNKQLESTKQLLYYITNRDNIDLHVGLYDWIKRYGVQKAFDVQNDAYYGKVKGLLTHINIRKDKEDCHPQPELVDMILSL